MFPTLIICVFSLSNIGYSQLVGRAEASERGVAVSAGLDRPSPLDYSPEELVSLYIFLAFGSELETIAEGYRPLIKRPANLSPIVLALPMESTDHRPGGRDALIEDVEAVADVISQRLGGTAFRSLSPRQLTTYFLTHQAGTATDTVKERLPIIFGNDEELKEILERYAGTGMDYISRSAIATLDAAEDGDNYCVLLTGTEAETPGVISEQLILINRDSDIESCLDEDMIHSFGLTNDFPAGSASILNDDNVFRLPTELDRFFLRVHADDRLLPGDE